MSFLDRVNECNNAKSFEEYLPFCVEGVRVGWVHRAFAPCLERFRDTFSIYDDHVSLVAGLIGYAERSAAVENALRVLDAEGYFSGWRGEPYPVGVGFSVEPLFEMERAAVPRFGVPAYGIHLHGFIREAEEILMWVGVRSIEKPTYPGKLDQMVAGGLAVGIGVLQNVIKEASEEAAVPAALAATAKPVGTISYCHESEEGIKPDVMFIYDLELPRCFIPRNIDGETAEFHLLPVHEVMEITAQTTDFKFNCAVANIDFFIRYGLFAPEEPDYVDIVRGMHR